MNKHPFRDSYDRYYIDMETGERAYASDGAWAPIMVRALLLIFIAVTVAAVI
jgi:hypothetical protein